MILLKVVLVTVDPPTAETERADYAVHTQLAQLPTVSSGSAAKRSGSGTTPG